MSKKKSKELPSGITKEDMKHNLKFCFRLKQTVNEAHEALVKAYGEEHALSLPRCQYWFKRFENGNFTVDNSDDSALKIEKDV